MYISPIHPIQNYNIFENKLHKNFENQSITTLITLKNSESWGRGIKISISIEVHKYCDSCTLRKK